MDTRITDEIAEAMLRDHGAALLIEAQVALQKNRDKRYKLEEALIEKLGFVPMAIAPDAHTKDKKCLRMAFEYHELDRRCRHLYELIARLNRVYGEQHVSEEVNPLFDWYIEVSDADYRAMRKQLKAEA